MADTGLPDFVQSSREKAQSSSDVAGQFAQASLTIPDQLNSVINDAIKQNQGIFDIRSTALSNFLSSPERAEAKFGVDKFSTGDQAGQENPNYIFNPFERNKAISEFISTEQIPFTTANSLAGQVVGSGEKIIDAGTRSFQAHQAAAQAAAQSSRQVYEDTLNEFLQGNNVRMGNEQLALQKEQLSLQKSQAEAGNKFDPYDQNAELNNAVAIVTATLDQKKAAGETITPELIDSLYAAMEPQLARIGMSPDELNFWKEMSKNDYIESTADSGPGLFGQLGSFFQGGEPRGSVTDPLATQGGGLPRGLVAPSDFQGAQSNLGKGTGVVNNFLQKNNLPTKVNI